MSILDAVAEKLDCRQYDNYLAAVCVFHRDSSPSLMVHEDTFKCLACGQYGTTKYLLKYLNGNEIIHQPTVEEEFPVSNPFYRWLKKNTIQSVMRDAWKTLNSFPYMGTYLVDERNIDAETRKSLGIGWKDGYYTFPIMDMSNRVVGGFVRCPPGASRRYFVPKGHDPNLLYIPKPRWVRDQPAIFMTFGAIDSISIMQMGYGAMSTTDGKQVDPASLAAFRKPIIVLPDEGEEREAFKLIKNLGWRGHVRSLCYPEGCKDVNDYFRRDRYTLQQELEEIYRRVTWR